MRLKVVPIQEEKDPFHHISPLILDNNKTNYSVDCETQQRTISESRDSMMQSKFLNRFKRVEFHQIYHSNTKTIFRAPKEWLESPLTRNLTIQIK